MNTEIGFENNDEINFHIDDLNSYTCNYTSIDWKLSYIFLTSSNYSYNYTTHLSLISMNRQVWKEDLNHNGFINIGFYSSEGDYLSHFSDSYMTVEDSKLSGADPHISYTYGINIS